MKPELAEIATVNVKSSRERSIGAILIDAGRLTPERAEKILAYQREHSLRFGDAALAMGLLTQDDVRYALSHQFEYTYLAPGSNPTTSEVVAAYQPNSPCVEAMRALRSQLMLRWLDAQADRKSLAIVGVDAGVGKTFTTANLSVVFSQLGEKTLLIDANLRAPRLHQLFKVENQAGLSTILNSSQAPTSGVVELPAFAGLSLLPAGPLPPNPQELLSKSTFRTLLANVVQEFDVVLIDTPSWTEGADAQIIASRAGASLLVVRVDHTSVAGATNFVEIMGLSGCRVLGSVLNSF